MRKILYVTGNRSEYGLFKDVLKSINDHPKLELILIVTGTHLSKKYGNTLNDIKRDGFRINNKIKLLN